MRLIRHIHLQKSLEGVMIKDRQSTLAITMHDLQRVILLVTYPYAGFPRLDELSGNLRKGGADLVDVLSCETSFGLFVGFLLLLRGAGCR